MDNTKCQEMTYHIKTGQYVPCPMTGKCPLHTNYWKKVWGNREQGKAKEIAKARLTSKKVV